MASSLVDSNVIIDILEDSAWAAWAERRILSLVEHGKLVINQIIISETAIYFSNVAQLDRSLAGLRISREDLPWEAAIKGGLAHSAYRRAGGQRDRVLPDFLIGAHANLRGYSIITRDANRYRNYFPDLDIIAPDTHP
jgi:predicted nucleic acid-binding protein